MNILHIIGSFDKKNGGTHSAILSITSIENQLGLKNEILSISHDNQEYDEIFNGKVILHKPSFPNYFSTSESAVRWLDLNITNFDLIVLHEVWSVIAVKAAHRAARFGIPYIIWPHGSLDPFDLNKKKFPKIIIGNLVLKNILRRANAICCTSEIESQLLECYHKKPVNKVILPLPIDFNLKGSRQMFRRSLSIRDDSFVFLFLSRIDYKKGIDVFLKSLSVFIKLEIPNIKLVIAGSGTKEYVSHIRSVIENLGIQGSIIQAGFLSGKEKADAFAGSDCFILTSMNENYGISIIEALQSNLPVLISDNVYIWKNIIPQAGWVCSYDEESILNAIREIYKQSLNDSGHNKSPLEEGDKFRMSRLISEYENFYLNIVSKIKSKNG